ncbi:ORF1 [Shayang Fly Virus 3]|uniref:Nucleoprotein n=1 Tax=Shayang Fly Virus 3 TaxID=1608067 RepID=A0A0B5KTF9_9RHAB|nr:ORF1 [Shayang Fly Virus 3]AJG39127.1 ORF1 [Shayang Fly Virus 3]
MTEQQSDKTEILQNPNAVTAVEEYLATYNVHGSSGAELNVWNEKYFVNTHVPKTKYELPTLMSRRNAGINLLHFFTGKKGMYEGWMKDIQICVLAMKTPGDETKLLFEDFMQSESRSDVAGTSTALLDEKLSIADGYANVDIVNEEPGTSSGAVLAGDVDKTKETEDLEQPANLSMSAVKGFWGYILDIYIKSSDAKPHAKLATAETIMGLICMNCFKLISKTENSVFKSMTRNLHKHYVDLFRPSDLVHTLCPPHINTLVFMKAAFGSLSGVLRDCLSMMISRVIIENSTSVPAQATIGVLYSACLTHVGMHGLAAVKHVEQTALAMGLSISKFSGMIMTTRVKDSLLNVLMLLKIGATPAKSLIILGKSYDVPFQFSWRFCRIYNPAHFSRFVTANNTHLIIRCAAYMGHLQDSSSILDMKILQGTRNQSIFAREKTIAQRYFAEEDSKGDAPIVDAAKSLYGDTHHSVFVPSTNYDQYLNQ